MKFKVFGSKDYSKAFLDLKKTIVLIPKILIKFQIDRTHAEVSDGTGVIKGAFSYIDPRGELRSVEYVADEHGFYPTLSHENNGPHESDAVKLATQRHFELYNRIAAQHQNPEVIVSEFFGNLCLFSIKAFGFFHFFYFKKSGPRETVAVEKAKQKHFTLFEKIAAEHAQIAAQREAERIAFEATSEHPIEEYDQNLH